MAIHDRCRGSLPHRGRRVTRAHAAAGTHRSAVHSGGDPTRPLVAGPWPPAPCSHGEFGHFIHAGHRLHPRRRVVRPCPAVYGRQGGRNGNAWRATPSRAVKLMWFGRRAAVRRSYARERRLKIRASSTIRRRGMTFRRCHAHSLTGPPTKSGWNLRDRVKLDGQVSGTGKTELRVPSSDALN